MSTTYRADTNITSADSRFTSCICKETDALAEVLSQAHVDAVIHFAAHSMVGESTRKPELYFLNNDGGSASLLSAMIQADVKRLVFSSTAAVYGTPKVVPIPEDLPFDPVNPYGESKVLVEKMLKWMDIGTGLRSIALRYFNACGADPESGLGEEHDPETHLIPLLIRAVVSGEPMMIFGDDYDTPDGTCIRDYIHVTRSGDGARGGDREAAGGWSVRRV